MTHTQPTPGIVRRTQQLEEAEALDGAVRTFEPKIMSLFGGGRRGEVLRGEWLGHAIHPPMTDLVIGSWTSATILDLIGGRESSAAAQRLIAVGLAAFGPTAWTGWAEWSQAGPREKRVGLVHALTNAVSVGFYGGSWVARRRGRHGTGATLALAGAGVSGVAAYLGGHMVAARKVGSHHPAYDAPAGV